MSSEVCPFCGKPFKRLKSHLPHCKAADRSKTPPAPHDGAASQKSLSLSSPQETPALPQKTPKSKKSTLSSAITPQANRSKKVSVSSAATEPASESARQAAPLKGVNASSSSRSSSSPNAVSLSASTKRKQRLADQIKMAATSSSSTISISSSASPSSSLSPSPVPSKTKKKSLRALIEAAKSSTAPDGSLMGTKSTSQDLLSVSTPLYLAADPLTSNRPSPKGTRVNPDKDSDIQPASSSTDTKPKGATKKTASQTDKDAQSPSATDASSDSQDSKEEHLRNSAKPSGRDKREDSEGKGEDLFGKERFWRSERGHQARITLQDVKSTLTQSNIRHQSSKRSTMSPIKTNDNLPGKPETKGPFSTSLNELLAPALNQTEWGVNRVLSPATQSDQSASTGSENMEQPSVKEKSPKKVTMSKQAPLIPPQDDGPAQPKPASLLSPVPVLHPGLPSSLVSLAAPSVNQGLNSSNHKMGILTGSPSGTQFMERGTRASPSSSAAPPFLSSPWSSPVKAETVRAGEGFMNEKTQFTIREQNVADNVPKGALAQRSLGQVRLRELPEWLTIKTPSSPREIPEMLQRGWQWYYRRYIDVRKGGIGGVGMLLAGYCVLSYIWSYPHIKRDRWRKYH
ncbi:uncharacterized serine-rich protein C215.13 [Myripristis murdjan]|uniref:Uncharacterized protein n=1 Tax=Myripristis murdjan TaxID=586833 RepID=A0A667ZXE7_9TELE|nr:uncharacterized protein C17orf80 homolog [Myripristis murdjan]